MCKEHEHLAMFCVDMRFSEIYPKAEKLSKWILKQEKNVFQTRLYDFEKLKLIKKLQRSLLILIQM